jgi:LacI family transcriptional regulator
MTARTPRLEPNRLPTMSDVAALAGVSRATVSFVINKRAGQTISEQTRHRVLAAVESLGYRPNRSARNLRAQRTATLGYVNHEPAGNPFAGQGIAGAHDAAWKHGCALLVINTARNTARMRAGIEDLIDRRVDAVLFAVVGTRRATVPKGLLPVPTVMVNCFMPGGALPSVLPDDQLGGYQATRQLLDAGHEQIAMLAGLPGAWATRERVHGYHAALAEAGLDPAAAPIAHGNYRADSGYRLTQELITSGTLPTGLVCGNDRMALGAYLALGEAGLRVPDDVSVVGYDDQDTLAAEIHPALTTIRLPYYDMGFWAAEQLLTGRAAELPRQTRLPCRPVVRDSVAAPRRPRRRSRS